MEMGFLMTFLAAYIGSQEKTFKQKMLPLTVSGIVVYILGRLWGEEADPIMLAIYVAGSVFLGGWGHVAQNYGNKKISLKFWKSKKTDEE